MSSAADLVREAERQRCRAIADRDQAALERVLADDLRYLHSTGALEGKSEYIETSIGGVPRSVHRGELQVRTFDDVAMVVGDYTIAIDPETAGAPGRRVAATGLQVWVLRNGRWQLLAHQGTPQPTSYR